MSKKLTLCFVLLSLFGFSQSPDLINYQGMARNSDGSPMISTPVGLKFELRQGSATSPTVFAEQQTATTSSLGLFSTQIGKMPGSNFNNVNWESGSLFLEVSLSLSGGTYTSMGMQQLVSVPFSMHAKSVPATYTNNILTIGANTFTLISSSGTTYSAGTGIAITSGSIINTAPDVPVTFTSSSSSNIGINGSYPNFGISYTATPVPTSLTLNGANNNSLSAGNNTVVLNTYTTGAGLTMTGGPNYTITSSASNPTINGLGVAVVSPTTGSSFTVTVPNPSVAVSGTVITLTQGASTSTAGISPPSLVLSGANNNSLSAGNNTVALNTYTAGTGITLSGGPNYTISSSAASPTINGLGVAVVSPTTGSNFTVTVPNPSVAVSGTVITLTQGASTSTAGLTPPSLALSGTNNSNLTAGNNTVTLNTYTAGAGLSMTGGPNYTITSAAASPTINGYGVAVVSPTTGSNYSVTVPNPSVAVSGSLITLTQGASTSTAALSTYTVGSGLSISGGPNYTITSSAASPTINGQGVAVVTPTTGSNFTVSVPNPSVVVSNTLLTLTQGASTSTTALNSYTVGSGLTMTGGPNYTITSTAASPTIQGAGVAIVSPTTGSNFLVTVPGPSVTVTGTLLTLSQGTAVSTATLNNITVTGSGIATVTPAGSNYNVDVTAPSFFAAGASSVQGSYPSYTITTPFPPTATVVGTGAAVVTPSTGMNYVIDVPLTNITATNGIAIVTPGSTNAFNINVPAPAYNATNGNLVTGTSTSNITQALTFTNNILTAGPASNSVSIPASVNASIYPAGSATVLGFFPSFTVSAPASPTVTGTGLAIVSPSTGANITVNVPVLTYTASSGLLGSGTNTVDITSPITLNGTTLSVGPASNSVLLSGLSPFVTTGANIYQTTLSNSVGIGTNVPAAKLDIAETAGYSGRHLKVQNINGANGSNMVDFSTNGTGVGLNVSNTNASATSYAGYFDGGAITRGKNNNNTSFAFRTQDNASTDLFVVRNDGHVGIGAPSPTAVLTVSNTTASETGYFEVNNGTSPGHALVLSSNSTNQHTMRSLNTSAALNMYAGMFEGGLIARGKNTLNTGYAFKAQNSLGPDLFVIRNDGNVGVNNSSPTATLDINGTMRLADGSQAAGRVLTSDAIGNASWQAAPGWGLSGNAGTTPSLNFIGTTDNNDLNFRINNLRAGSIQANNYGVFLGYLAGPAVTVATSGNTGIGREALTNLTTGASNVAVGAVALKANTTGSQNHAIGDQALLSNTTGNSNIAIGYHAMNLNLNGSDNIGIGYNALAGNNGNQNVAMGNGALLTNGTGNNNTALGYFASRDNANGSANTAMGSSALQNNTSGSMNTSLGYFTGLNNLAGSGNVFLGYAAGYFETGSNKLYIANSNGANPLIYGDFANGRVGINTTNVASHNFNIYDPGTASSLRMSNSTTGSLGFVIGQNNSNVSILNYENTPLFFGTNGANRMVISNTGAVGINNSTPSATLDVIGNVKIVDGTQALNKVLTSDAVGNASWQALLPVPSGAITAYGGTAIPSGWLLCDGQSYLRTSFTNLFTAIGTAWGAVDGTHFNVPDMRGMFLRGVDGGSGSDPNAAARVVNNNAGGNSGNNVGSEQADAYATHSHTLPGNVVNNTLFVALLGTTNALDGTGGANSTAASGGSETRPKNVYVYYIIKQ